MFLKVCWTQIVNKALPLPKRIPQEKIQKLKRDGLSL
jgi:hypothetical protein